MTPQDPALSIAVYILIFVVVFLLLREVNCWYWKINKRLQIEEENNDLLTKILDELRDSRSDKEPECSHVGQTGQFCTQCGARLK